MKLYQTREQRLRKRLLRKCSPQDRALFELLMKNPKNHIGIKFLQRFVQKAKNEKEEVLSITEAA